MTLALREKQGIPFNEKICSLSATIYGHRSFSQIEIWLFAAEEQFGHPQIQMMYLC